MLAVFCAGLELGPSCAGLSARLGRWNLILQNCATTSILAVVPAGAGSNLMLSLNVGGQTVSYFGRNFTYAPPVIMSMTSPGTVQPLLMPTTAILNDGTVAYVVIQGTGFGPAASSLAVFYGTPTADCVPVVVLWHWCFGLIAGGNGLQYTSPNCTRELSQSMLTCKIVAGIGMNLTWVVQVEGVASAVSLGVQCSAQQFVLLMLGQYVS